jgi:hypothetical protein
MRIPWYLFKLGSNYIIFENFENFNNYLFKMPNFRKLQGREKLQKNWWKPTSFFYVNPSQSTYLIIDNTFFSSNLVEYYVFPFLQKKRSRKCYKKISLCESFKVQKVVNNP